MSSRQPTAACNLQVGPTFSFRDCLIDKNIIGSQVWLTASAITHLPALAIMALFVFAPLTAAGQLSNEPVVQTGSGNEATLISGDSVPMDFMGPASSESSQNSIDSNNETSDLLAPASTPFTGPAAVTSQLRDDQEVKSNILDINLSRRWEAIKQQIQENRGLELGGDYNSLYFVASESLGENTSGTGVFRFYGKWNLTGRGTPDTGSIVFKIEDRHAYSDVAATAFGSELGYVGLVNSVFSDQGFRATHLFWRQSFAESKGISYIGFLDITDYTDVYALASPWTGFSNLAFQSGSGTIGGLPDGALGAMAGRFLTENVYIAGSLVDANSNPTKLFGGFDTFFNDFETFKTLELGWTTSSDELFLNNVHATFWQIDEREQAGTPSGWGVAFSASQVVGKSLLPFIRGGWSDGGGALYDASLSTGVGYQRPSSSNLHGIGLNWSHPSEETFGADLDDQFTAEFFSRLQLTESMQITPSLQLIGNPALNPQADSIAIFGLRARVSY